MKTIYFEEEQRMNHWWLWIIVIPITILFLYALYQQLYLGVPFGQNPMNDLGLVAFSAFIIGLFAMVFAMRLRTKIDNNGIQMSYAPFIIKKHVTWDKVLSVKVVNYGFVGYGIRWGSKFGTIYNIKGNKGIAIELLGGKKFLIGTQQPETVSSVISELLKNNK